MIRNKNNYKYIYAESTSFKSLTSIHCHQNKYLKKAKIKLLNSGGKNTTKSEEDRPRKGIKKSEQHPQRGFYKQGFRSEEQTHTCPGMRPMS